MKEFNEKFPSLKEKQVYCEILQEDNREGICTGMLEKADVETFCLDKQKVKEAIDTYLTTWKTEQITCKCRDCADVKAQLVERDKLLEVLGI